MIDARGLSCPQPVILVRNAAKTQKEISVTVDNPCAVENITRFAENRGYSVSVSESGGEFVLELKK